MTNPFDPAYLASASALFGPLAWVFLLLQVALLGAGGYLFFVRKDGNAFRKRLLQRLGYVLMGVGSVGVAFAALRLGGVGLFTYRFWFYLILLLELMLAAYVAYYGRFVYRKELAITHTSRGRAEPRQSVPPPARVAASSPKPGTTGRLPASETEKPPHTGRRDSRSARKRKRG